MPTVTLGADADLLRHVSGTVAVLDSAGRLLGTFFPSRSNEQTPEVPFSEEEIRWRSEEARSGKVYTTAEVLKYLGGLGGDR